VALAARRYFPQPTTTAAERTPAQEGSTRV
jgi:hypothetical protein